MRVVMVAFNSRTQFSLCSATPLSEKELKLLQKKLDVLYKKTKNKLGHQDLIELKRFLKKRKFYSIAGRLMAGCCLDPVTFFLSLYYLTSHKTMGTFVHGIQHKAYDHKSIQEKINNYSFPFQLHSTSVEWDTLPISSGILIMAETMYTASKQNTTIYDETITAFMFSLPMGMFHQAMFISKLDWDNKDAYNYLRWNSSYDHFSYNFMASINPSKVSNNLQLMLIYNH